MLQATLNSIGRVSNSYYSVGELFENISVKLFIVVTDAGSQKSIKNLKRMSQVYL